MFELLSNIFGMWIGKDMNYFFSYPYIYIVMLLLWGYVIIRNNSIKNSLLIILLMGGLFLYNYVMTDIMHLTYIPFINILFTAIVFLLLLFRSFPFFIISLLFVLHYYLFSYSLSTVFLKNAGISLLGSLIFYAIYYFLNRRLVLDDRKLISEQYTKTGYFVPDICLLNIVYLVVFFAGLINTVSSKII